LQISGGQGYVVRWSSAVLGRPSAPGPVHFSAHTGEPDRKAETQLLSRSGLGVPPAKPPTRLPDRMLLMVQVPPWNGSAAACGRELAQATKARSEMPAARRKRIGSMARDGGHRRLGACRVGPADDERKGRGADPSQ